MTPTLAVVELPAVANLAYLHIHMYTFTSVCMCVHTDAIGMSQKM